MESSSFKFLNSLRYASTLEQLRKELMSKAEFFESNKQWVIVEEETSTCYGFDTFFARKTRDAANDLLAAVEEEMEKGVFDEQKRKKLQHYIFELTNLAEKFKGYFHLENFAFVGDHTLNVVKNLKTHYLPPERSSDDETFPTTTTSKIKWTGGVASLGTMFRELSTKPFFNSKGPNIVATPKQLATFLFENFVDEHDEQFSYDSLYTFLARSDKEAKRNKIPLGEIDPKKK